jgi:type VI secretion system secreted protein Hcp
MSIAAMYLNLTGVTGECTVDKHVGDIDLVSWSWGMQSSHYISTGAPSGAAQFSLITVVKRFDRATPTLFQFLDTHKVVSKGTLTVSKSSGGTPLEYVTIDLNNVRIVTVDVRSDDAELVENVTLSAETITVNYTPQASGGALASAPITFTAQHPAAQ